ncbi:MAG: hypothetical protein IPG00_13145 [Saprospiraceae bacterium]|nr:hypothetical protein [Saprospiraceae bacterium]
MGVDPWGCAANWNVGQPWELADNCAKAEGDQVGRKSTSRIDLEWYSTKLQNHRPYKGST